ncbi:serine palmitoyltransferase 2-like isoform X3 [Dermatophagoides pteronyssinus]|uniref:serine palmitoyltransferase 2-like isoform X3 n=1 Tax=Dermatophagoides pteronyssinus TaxID=6956 RepID=UPI003F676771
MIFALKFLNGNQHRLNGGGKMNNYENQAMIQIKNSTIMMTNGYHHHNHHNDHTIKSSFDQNYSNGQLNHQINGGKKNGFCHHENEKISNGIHHNADDNDKVKQSNGGNGFIVFGNNGCLPVVDDDDDDNNDTQQHCPKLQLSSLKKSNYPFVNGTTKNGILKKYPTEKNGFKHSSISYYCSTATTATDNSKLKIKSTPDNRFNRYEQPPYHIAFLCYISYAVLILFGYIRDFMRKTGLEKNLSAVERDREGYTSLYKSFESFYTRNIYRRIRDAWNRPIASVPGAEIDVVDRYSSDENWTFEYPGTKSRVINMGSYNYLGYAENSGPIHEKVIKTIYDNGVGICSTRNELGHNEHVKHLEQLMARFLGVEACVVFGMGFATNSTNIQCFVGQGCLIMSDSNNHASLILGCRLSGATIRKFKHNNMKDLEHEIRRYIVEGQPKTGEPWNKIIIVVEGIYSMEGTIVNLPELIRIKKQYKCYIYLDEAHSIGALGPNARGVIDYFGCDPSDVDILMGTFTKSFGAAGGYVAGSRDLVNLIRINSFSHYYANPMSVPIAMQISCVVQSLSGEDGTDDGRKRIQKLAHNSRYFRKKLRQLGFIVYGHDDSPVVPLLLCFCSKIAAVIRMAHDKGLGFIGAGYPATPLTTGRVRFCISAAHTKDMLDRSLNVMNEIGDKINIKYSAETVDDDNDDEIYDYD